MVSKKLWPAVGIGFALAAFAVADEGEFDSNGVKIRYVTAGQGEPVILIHGWMGDSSMWGRDAKGNPKLNPLEGFQAIALDCRGHGKSEKLHDPAQYGAEMAADVVRLLDHLKIKRAHLIGYSMGTFIAAKVVATHPNRVFSVTYGGQAPLLAGEAGSREIDVFAKAVDEGKGLGPYLMEVRPGLTPEAANALAKMLYDGKDVKAWAAAGRSFVGLEVSLDALVKAKVPSLFVYGSMEGESTRTRIANVRRALTGSKEQVIEGADHVTALAKPEFGASIKGFLISHRSPGGKLSTKCATSLR